MKVYTSIEIEDGKLILNDAFVENRGPGEKIAIYLDEDRGNVLLGTPQDLLSFAEQVKNLVHLAEITRLTSRIDSSGYGMYTVAANKIVSRVVDYAIKNDIQDYEKIAEMVIEQGRLANVPVNEVYDTVVRENIYNALNEE